MAYSCNAMLAFKEPDVPILQFKYALPFCHSLFANFDNAVELVERQFVLIKIANHGPVTFLSESLVENLSMVKFILHAVKERGNNLTCCGRR